MSTCMHVDGEFCDLCYKPKQSAQACINNISKSPVFMTEAQAILDLNQRLTNAIERYELKFIQVTEAVKQLTKLHELSVDYEKNLNLRVKTLEDFVAQNYKVDIASLNARLKEAERFQDITHEQYKLTIKRKHPHKCPVCDGKGDWRFKHYSPSDGFTDLTCLSCEGKGIVWG